MDNVVNGKMVSLLHLMTDKKASVSVGFHSYLDSFSNA